MRGACLRVLLIALGCLAACSPGVAAEVLLVGPERSLRMPSEAAGVAQDGDVVRFDPGEYVDCAIWRASSLVLEAPEGAAHVRDRACAGKAIWVIAGDDVTVENITFSGARVPDQNGAGIRAEGKNLTVRNSRFYDNENGILGWHGRRQHDPDRGQRLRAQWQMRRQLRPWRYVNQIARLKGRQFDFPRNGSAITSSRARWRSR